MGDGNERAVSFEKSASADGNNMNPTCSSSDYSNRLKKLQNRPDSLRIELLQSARNSYLSTPSDLSISFRNITYNVKHGLFLNKQKCILKNVNGTFNGGELIALMGPSGAGKTTLMKILAGYTTSGVMGELLLNQDIRDERTFRKNSCFIMQDDNLHPLLTANETMHLAANLKFQSMLTHKEKQEKVEEVMNALGLWGCRASRTKSLSGGQRKRLSIGVELLNNPRIMFFDEPISGLDSSTSKQCIMLLKQLGQEGRIIICTIHQPSAIIFELFDSLYAMANGYCVYQGSIKGLVPYLSETGLECPPYHNPADYLLEVASGDYGDNTIMLKNKCENGLCQDWARNQRDTIQLQTLEHVDKMMSSGLITPVKSPKILPFELLSDETSKKTKEKIYDTTFFTQLYVLFKRTCLILTRDPTLTYSRIITHIAIAFFIGTLYFDIGKDASNALNNCNYILFSNLFLMYTAFSSVITTFPLDLPILIREHFNRWYSLKTYFLAITFADLPVQMIATLSYAAITYFMTAQPLEMFRISSFFFVSVLISLTAQSFGLIIGAIMSIQDAVIFGPFSVLPFLMFSGFFVRMRDAQVFLRWMFHISFVKYGWEGLMLSVFGYDREKMPCSADYCHFVYPEKFLEEVQMNEASYGYCVLFLIGLTVSLRIIAFFALKIKLWIRT